MRIGVDGRFSGNHFPGIGRYSEEVVRALAELKEHTVVLMLDPRMAAGRYDLRALGALPNVEIVELRAAAFGPAAQLLVPALARRQELDLLHSPYFVKPYAGMTCPSVVTIFDLLGRHFPETLSWRGRLLYRAMIALAVNSADAIVTISEHAWADLVRWYPQTRDKLVVTPLAAGRAFRPQGEDRIAAVRERYELPPRYALYVGSNKPHKNLGRLLQAWKLAAKSCATSDMVLAVAGHEDRKHPGAKELAGEAMTTGRIRLLPNIAEAELPALYSGAEFFVFPSCYEGFGLPPLEAMACGAPVLCSNAASLPEVVGTAALLVDPYAVGAMAEGMVELAGDPGLRRELRSRGLRQAREFSWRRTALATSRAYELARRRERRQGD